MCESRSEVRIVKKKGQCQVLCRGYFGTYNRLWFLRIFTHFRSVKFLCRIDLLERYNRNYIRRYLPDITYRLCYRTSRVLGVTDMY